MTTHVDSVTDVDAMGRAEAPGQRSLLRSVAMPAEHGSWGLTFEPVLLGLLLAAVELWFDMRSRSRRLLPELVGAIGMGGVAAVIVLAGGGSGRLAAACWMILAARSVTAIVTVRDQVGGLHRHRHRRLRPRRRTVDDRWGGHCGSGNRDPASAHRAPHAPRRGDRRSPDPDRVGRRRRRDGDRRAVDLSRHSPTTHEQGAT